MSQHADLYEVLKKPIITEKSTALQEFNQYVFEVQKTANKIQIRKAFELAFPGRKVTKVCTLTNEGLERRFGKRMGKTQDVKKAIISITPDSEPLEMFTGV